MTKYRVTVSNTLYFTYDVEAESVEDAEKQAIQQWSTDEVWAYSDDDGGYIDSVEIVE